MHKKSEIVRIHPSKAMGEKIVNEDGYVWETEVPKDTEPHAYLYHACIPDARINHFSFESFGWHQAFADTIDELVEDIRSFGVPYYSGGRFLSMLRDNDKKEIARDRQVELYFDSRGTKVTRGEYGINNMTEYTSF